MTGTLTSAVPVRVEMVMRLCAIDGELCMHPESIKSVGLELGPILERTGVTLDRFLDLSGAKGLRVEGSLLILDPKRVLDSPAIDGSVSAVRVEGDEVVLTFGRLEDTAPAPSMPLPSARNYLHFRGGTLRFGRLFQVRADLQLVDADPSDPFEFDLARYQRQLVAGHSRSLENGGLLVVIPDLDDVERGVRATPPPRTGPSSDAPTR